MLNADKIKLMTKLSLFEEKEKSSTMLINHYFKKDYISFQMIQSAVFITLSFIAVIVLYVLYSAENWIANAQIADLVSMGSLMLVSYIACLALYLVLTYLVSSRRYERAKKNQKVYHSGLKRLNRVYEVSERSRDGNKKVR